MQVRSTSSVSMRRSGGLRSAAISCLLVAGLVFVSHDAAAAIPPPHRPAQARPLNYTFGQGYALVGSDGGLFDYGIEAYSGGMAGHTLNAPIVGMAALPGTSGYWEVGSDGGVYAFGNAASYGSMGGQTLNAPVVGMATTRDGGGYWLVGSDGGIYAFGDAAFYGSMGGQTLNAPIVGMAATTNGRGYWLVGADGGVYAFGNATYQGGEAGTSLPKPIVGMAANPDGTGYWMVSKGGAVYSFGDAVYFGGTGSTTLQYPIVGITASQDGRGYWIAGSDGGIAQFGDAEFQGAIAPGTVLGGPIVGIAAADTLDFARSLATNGGFENGTSGWTVESGTNVAIYGAGGVNGENPYQGNNFLAMNSTSNGGIYQQITTPISAGMTFCVSAELASQGWSTTATGTMTLFMLGSTAQEASNVAYGPLPGQSEWTYYQSCVMATTAHTELQVSFYLGAGTTTVDNLQVTRDLAENGGFNNGMSDWTVLSGTSYATYGSGQVSGENPYEGSGFEAMGGSGGGISQTFTMAINEGEIYCAAARVSTQGTGSNATGSLHLTLTSSAGTDTNSTSYGPLPGSNIWSLISTCVTATATRTSFTVQFTLGAGTTTVDDVNVT